MYRINEDGKPEKITLEELQKLTKSETIFRPPQPRTKGLKLWLEKKISGDNTLDLQMRRFNRVHTITKNWMFKPVMKLLRLIMGRYAINSLDDIPLKPWNNHARMFYHCWQEALIDDFAGVPFNNETGWWFARPFKNRFYFKDYLTQSGYWSYENRKDFINLWMTEILEDTFDRNWLDYMMIRLYWTMHEHYNGNVPKLGEYPKYTGRICNNKQYFDKFVGKEVWIPKDKMR